MLPLGSPPLPPPLFLSQKPAMEHLPCMLQSFVSQASTPNPDCNLIFPLNLQQRHVKILRQDLLGIFAMTFTPCQGRLHFEATPSLTEHRPWVKQATRVPKQTNHSQTSVSSINTGTCAYDFLLRLLSVFL